MNEHIRQSILVSDGRITTNSFRYDSLRYEKQDSQATSKMVYDGQNYLIETDEADQTQVVYLYKPEQYGRLLAEDREE